MRADARHSLTICARRCVAYACDLNPNSIWLEATHYYCIGGMHLFQYYWRDTSTSLQYIECEDDIDDKARIHCYRN